MRSPWHEAPRRRAGWFALIAAVILVHLLFAARVAANLVGWDSGGEPRRIDIALVQELVPAAPPPVAPPPPPPPPVRRSERAAHVARASSAPQPAASTPEEAASASHEALKAEALALAASVAAAAEPASAPALAASSAFAAASAPIPGPPQPALDWPPSTRLTYTLTGRYRGPLYGTAVVEWRREGTHYQVAFDFHVSPFFDQHMFSDGQIAEDGLRPQHYDESRKFPFGELRTKKIEFGEDEVQLANGNRVPRLPQSQDPASQFVQFVWIFTTHPEWLRPGNTLEIPLALPNNLRRWQYEVGQLESLSLPFGAIDATHLKPIGPHKPNEYPFEIWTAPTLRYLPVRIHVPLGDENYADLELDSRPLQAAATPPAVPASMLP